jgi:signal transduction histidine kinase
MQNEINMLPQFQNLTGPERRWVTRLDMDIYVPIHAQNEWVGLLALGTKTSGSPYFSEDIDLLHLLADQTAVALQNARLVKSLMQVNSEFRRAYSSMEGAHTKLQRLDKTKSDFISITSHELRTPLTIISGYSQMLLEDPQFKENPPYLKMLQGIYDGTQRLHEIVESMLEVAKIDMQELTLRSESVQVAPVLRKVCKEFASAFRERKMKLRFDDDAIASLPDIDGDAEALTKVFHHLVSNAIKYTPDGGMISISGRQLPEEGDESTQPIDGIEIVVSDTGVGIDPRYKELIFTKFYQTGDVDLHSSGKTKFMGGGSGLGLTIVRGIVQAHGGRVWAESPGHNGETTPGSEFHVVLPLIRDEKQQTQDVKQRMIGGS